METPQLSLALEHVVLRHVCHKNFLLEPIFNSHFLFSPHWACVRFSNIIPDYVLATQHVLDRVLETRHCSISEL